MGDEVGGDGRRGRGVFRGQAKVVGIFPGPRRGRHRRVRRQPADGRVADQLRTERKFAWFWLYNVTNKNPDGVPHLMLAIDHEVDSAHVRDVQRVGTRRWNHQIVVATLDDARSAWLAELIGLAYAYGGGGGTSR